MASDFERDKSVDRVLSGARRGSPAEPAGAACLDAETLAAWADGGLAPDQARVVEAHLAGCARCRAMSAAFVAADLEVAEASSNVVPFKRNKVKYWLPIAGTVAATLVIWLGVQSNEKPQPSQVLADSLPAAPSPVFVPAEPRAGQAGAAITPSASTPLSRRPEDTARLSKKEGARADVAAAAESRAEPTAPKLQTVTALGGGVAKPTVPPPPVAGTPLPAPVPVNAPPPPPPTVIAATPPPPPVITQGQAAGTVGGVRDSMALAFRASVAIVAEFSSADPRTAPATPVSSTIGNVAGGAGRGGGGRGGGGGGGAAAGRARVTAEEVAMLPVVHWRIFDKGTVGKSTDRVTWEMIGIDPPAPALTAGAAPSPQVCWLVGPNGLVLRSTDARSFGRVTSPTSANLVRVEAVDALRATVTAADGQKYVTTDGGKTWVQVPQG